MLRLGPGDTVAVFDGRGQEFLAKVVTADRRDVRVQVLSRIEPATEAAVPLTLVQAVLKADKMDDIVRDAVMLGVAAVQPLITARTETTVAALVRGGRVDRWKRVALASVKQSRRAVVPDIRGPLTFESWLDEPQPAMTLMLVEPGGTTPAEPLSSAKGTEDPGRCGDRRRAGRRLDGRGAVGCASTWRPPRHVGPSHLARGRGARRRRQRAAIPLG